MQRLTSAADLQGFIRRCGPFALCLWDFDGVVADSEPRQAAAYRRVLAARGIKMPAHFFHELIGLTEPEIWDGSRRTMTSAIVASTSSTSGSRSCALLICEV